MIKNLIKKYFINKFKISKVGKVEEVEGVNEVDKANEVNEIQEIIEDRKENNNKLIRINPRYKIYTDTVKILSHPENSQLDNKLSPNSACNVTALQIAMSLDCSITDDELFILCNSKEIAERVKKKYPKDWSWIKNFFTRNCANEVWVVLEEVCKYIIGNDYCKIIHNLSVQKIIDEINMGYAVVVNGKFTHSGHFVTIVGYDLNKGCYIVNDPYGDWNTRYKVKKFLNLEYSIEKLKIRNTRENNKEAFLSNMAILVHSDKRIPAR